MSRFKFRSFYPFLIAVEAAVAGPNAGVEIDVAALNPPCGLEAGDTIEFLVTARHLQDVRQIKLEVRWQPLSAIDSVLVHVPESAQRVGLVAPFPPEVNAGAAELGLATFGDGVNGDVDLIRFTFLLASQVDSRSKLDVWVEEISLGPSFTERDTLNPLDATVLGNYCDDSHRILEHALLLDPDVQRAYFSRQERAAVLDDSEGEVEILARLLDGGVLAPRTTMRWTVTNSGPGTVYILDQGQSLAIEPGATRQHSSVADERGKSFLAFDARAAGNGEQTTAEIAVCAVSTQGDRCGVGRIEWEPQVTAVAVAETDRAVPLLQLERNYPNPFNGQTQIRFHVPRIGRGNISLQILNSAAQTVRVLADAPLVSGMHEIAWDGRDQQGRQMASGVYFAVLKRGVSVRTISLTLVR